jgi:hypothetical protein
LEPNHRLAFFRSKSPDTSTYVLCISTPTADLFQSWVFIPGGIFLFINVILILLRRNTILENWYRRRLNPHSLIKRKQPPGSLRFFKQSARAITREEEAASEW